MGIFDRGRKIFTAEEITKEAERAESLLAVVQQKGLLTKERVEALQAYVKRSRKWKGPDLYTQNPAELIAQRIVEEYFSLDPAALKALMISGIRIRRQIARLPPAEYSDTVKTVRNYSVLNLEEAVSLAETKMGELRSRRNQDYRRIIGDYTRKILDSPQSVNTEFGRILRDHQFNRETIEGLVEEPVILFTEQRTEASEGGFNLFSSDYQARATACLYGAALENLSFTLQQAEREIAVDKVGPATLKVASDDFAKQLELVTAYEEEGIKIDPYRYRQIAEITKQRKDQMYQKAKEAAEKIHDKLFEDLDMLDYQPASEENPDRKQDLEFFKRKLDIFKSLLRFSLSHSQSLELTDENGRPDIESMIRYGQEKFSTIGAIVYWQHNSRENKKVLMVEYEIQQYNAGIERKLGPAEMTKKEQFELFARMKEEARES